MPVSWASMRSTARCVLPVLVGPSSATLCVASAAGTKPSTKPSMPRGARRGQASGTFTFTFGATSRGRLVWGSRTRRFCAMTRGAMPLNDALKQRIDGYVASDRVVLFMKGTRRAPQCGFSAQVVQILDQLVPEYSTHDVLSSAELRDGIKDYSQWPTIPQLYIDGKFVGGCDIVKDLHAAGELEQLLGAEPPPVAAPKVTASAEAIAAFKAAMTDGDSDVLHLQISPAFEHDLFFGPIERGDVEADLGGLKLYVPRSSLSRAQGVHIGYLDGANAGFKIDNPNQPAQVVELSVPDAKAMLDRG